MRKEADLGQQEKSLQRATAEATENLLQQRRQETELQATLETERGELDAAKARLTALETLQQAALGGDESEAANWLAQQRLEHAPRLAQRLEVNNRWQLAVEAVLGDFLQAVSVEALDGLLNRLPDSNVLLFTNDALRYQEDSAPGYLLAEVRNAGPAAEMLARVRTADNLAVALQVRSQLASGESVITPDGIWISRTWVRVARRDAETGGVLRRETEMRELEVTIRSLEQSVERALEQREQIRQGIAELEQSNQNSQAELTQIAKAHAAAATELATLHNDLEKSRLRALALGQDTQTIETDIGGVTQEIRDANQRLSTAQQLVEKLAGREAGLKSEQQELQEECERNRNQAEQDRERYQTMAIELESRRSSRESATTTLERAQAQRSQLAERVTSLQAMMGDGEQPLHDLQEQLQEQLRLKVAVDDELRGRHETLEQANENLRSQESRRQEQENQVTNARSAVDERRLAAREEEIRRENIAEQFSNTGLDLETVQNSLPEDCTAEVWQERLDKIQRRLDRIGTVNLLAIEEFEEQSERAKYLEEQFADLTSALETLEKAIRKIDRETRARFQEVFDNVNAGLKRIFPRLFGGGHAYMSLEGDDLLNAGVTVMAQPPGKRNSNIHLLSGGEKALTAVALVFSIFELNPAPFCLLDEVDAPLDDANVGRFCEIVREMSANVQFLFITHNKITMEMAGQLMGVTMGEPGVSRLVSVDIDEAVKLAVS